LVFLLLLVFTTGPVRPAAGADDVPSLLVPRASGSATAAGPNGAEAVFHSVLAGRFLDEEPARRLAAQFQGRGLTAFVVQRNLVESRFYFDRTPVGEFYLTLVGLFGLPREADRLGSRLKAEGLITDYQVVGIADPGEVEATAAQTRRVDQEGERTALEARARASAPLKPSSPAATGEAYRQNVYGRYLGSYKDPLEAREHARTLTANGWAASVRTEGQGEGRWYRVFLAPSPDSRDFKADEEVIQEGQASVSSQMTLVFLVDLTSTSGHLGQAGPMPDRRDASACAGFSQAGRLGAVLSRTLIYVPDIGMMTTLIPAVRDDIKNVQEVPRRLNDWLEGRERRPQEFAAYGPTFFNRQEMERVIVQLQADSRPGSLVPALKAAAAPLGSQLGRKVLLIFSDFMGPAKQAEIQEALAALSARLGPSLDVFIIYGDPNGAGYTMAHKLAAGEAWDGCLLLHDNAYFEKYIKAVFK
jgi:cell division septation protein DedD